MTEKYAYCSTVPRTFVQDCSSQNFFALCSLHLCVPLFFDVILLPIATSVFPNLVTVATFYGELAGGFQPIRKKGRFQ